MLAGDTSTQNGDRELRELPEVVEVLGEAAAPLRPRLRELCALDALLTSFAPDGWAGSDSRIRTDERVRADLTALLDAAER